MTTFQEQIRKLTNYWQSQDCIIHQGYDGEVGAGTFNPATFLRCLGPEPYSAAYIEPCRRPTDGRYGENPNRLQHYFQFQVIIKPSPYRIQEMYLESLEAMGFDLSKHDIRFVHDDWENPTIGAWGLGWEVWMDGMEVTQFTYFQSVGGIPLKPITVELTYGIERLAMYLQNVNSIFDIRWDNHLTYGDIYHRNEVEWSAYNFEHASTEMWLRHFNDYEAEAKRLMEAGLPLPAYDFVMKASHSFNLLDARGAISVTERTGYITRIRDLSRKIAESYLASREALNFPLMDRFKREKEEKPVSEGSLDSFEDATPDQTDDFLLEIGSEELPATFVPIGYRNLEKAVGNLLDENEIPYRSINAYGTPRRIAIHVAEMALAKAPKSEERRGPAVANGFDGEGKPTRAAEGFLSSMQIAPLTLDQIRSGENPSITIKEVKGTEYLFAVTETAGCLTAGLLAEKLPSLILNLDFPKKMRWADLDITYARPLRWIVALIGKQIVPFTVGNIASGRTSYGHRQLKSYEFNIVKAKDYLSILKKYNVMADQEERRDEICRQLDSLCKGLNAGALFRDEVLRYVTQMTEWPKLIAADYNRNFLAAPQEVLTSEMVEHQFYFPIAESSGKLRNTFIITADTTPSEQIKQGNERVLSARLSDGVFLYKQGLKTPIQTYNDKLKTVTFQKELGTVYEKVERLIGHAEALQKQLGISTPAQAKRAAEISKFDLATEMVFEFPDLQGTIGMYYAEAAGEDKEVAAAIDEQWMPRHDNAPMPQTDTGALLSIADKIDNLLGCFSVGLKPTSSSDPYALRRQALGMIKIIISRRLSLPLKETLEACYANFPKKIRSDEAIADILDFFNKRVKTVFLDYNFNKDEIEASLSHGFNDIYDAYCRVDSLHKFRKAGNNFPKLYEVYKRAKGQINNHATVVFKDELLVEPAEKELDSVLATTENAFNDAVAARDYDRAYSLIAQIQPSLATLFDKVKILADDDAVKENRIALLQRVFALFEQLLDFSKIQELN